MVKIALDEAEDHLREIAEQVMRTGESVLLTRGDIAIVEIVPCRSGSSAERSQEEIFADIARIRRRLPPISREEIREAIDEGRL